MQPTLESVQQGVKNGLTPNQMAEQHGLTYKTFLAHMKKFGGFKKLKNEFGNPQFKAHQTMRKNELIAKYTTATSSGIKASISKEYQKTFGGLLKAELNTDDVAVIIEADHMCVAMRGVQDVHSSTVTSEFSGKFLDTKTREELIKYISLNMK
jgi:hypothetical protein